MRFEIIKDYPDYIIFENGIILNCKTDRFLVVNNGSGFYKTVRLRKDGKAKTEKVHRLLAKAFIPNPYKKNCVNHKDANKLNNNLSNLEWCTHQENMRHAKEMGLIKQSELNRKVLIESKQKLVINLENGIYYDSIKEAALYSGIPAKNLARYLSNTRYNITNFVLA